MIPTTRRRVPRASRPHGSLSVSVRPFAIGLSLVATGLTAVAQQHSSLVDAIPDDVYLVGGMFPNEERQFLEDHWADVWAAFEASGFLDEAQAMIASVAPEAERESMTAMIEQCQSWCDTVDWSSLGASEVVFAERLTEPMKVGGSLSLGPPDMVALFRQDAETARANYAGMAGILRGVVEQIAELSGADLRVEEHEVEGTKFTSFEPLAQFDEAPSMVLSIGLRDDTLIVSLGQTIRDEVAVLLAGGSTLKPISSQANYRAAFERLPEAEDSFFYFDMQILRASMDATLGALMDMAAASSGSLRGQGDIIKNARTDPEAARLTRDSYGAYQEGDYKEAMRLIELAYAADSTDSVVMYNLACYSALLGHKEQALGWLESSVKGGFYAPEKISEDSDLDTLREDDRFTEILNLARGLAEAELSGGEPEPAQASPELSIARVVIDRVLETLGMFDYGATVGHTEGTSVHTESLFTLREGAKSNPFYAVVNTPAVADFAEFLPREVTGFEVSGGFDPVALYDFLHESLAAIGPEGEQLLEHWQAQQDAMGINVRDGILGLIGTGSVSLKYRNDIGAEEWVFMQRVRQDEVVKQYLDMGLAMAPELIKEGMKQNPMLGMMALNIQPSGELEGFSNITIGMTQSKIVLGVEHGWLVLGSSPDAIQLARATAAGEHPSVRENELLASKAVFPDGPAQMVSFKDTSSTGEDMAAALRMVQMVGPMSTAQIPDAEVRKMMGKAFLLLGKLAPVMQRIDFFDSNASATTFDGMAWHTKAVVHYKGVPNSEHGPQ